MRYIVNGEEIQEIDKYSIEEIGIPSMVLMERAAMAVTERILDYIADLKSPVSAQVLVVTEGGNNGGDGLAVARMLQEADCRVQVWQIGGIKTESPQYQQQKKILEHMGISVRTGITEETLQEWKHLHFDVILDGVFGVGIHREIQSPQKEVIECLNQLEGLKCAIDMPSGIDSTSGNVLGIAFQADITITFGYEKTGQFLGAGAEYCGKVLVADIGFPKQALEWVKPACYCYDSEDLMRLPPRVTDGNKGTFGKVTVIAGSESVCGAAVLSAKGAYRTGCGLVEVITHVNNREAIQTMLPEALLHVYFTREEAEYLVTQAEKWADVIVIGPGIGVDEIGSSLVRRALASNLPLVIDADAITILSEQEAWWEWRNPAVWEAHKDLQMILTPHRKEMERISRIPIKELKENPRESAEALTKLGAVCVLKDARTVVAEPQEAGYYMNLSGNDGMATGGSGDVLSGIIASLVAQGLSLGEAARTGVYLHGLAGDRAAQQKGHSGMLAGDITDGLIDCLKESGR